MTAIVFIVAGMSSRFGGRIKQFAKVGPNGETLIEHSLNQALKAGFNKIIFVVGEKTEQPFKEKFGYSYMNTPIEYTKQEFSPEKRDRPWGTADATCTIKEIIKEPFVICNGDDIYGENSFKILYDHLQNSNEGATLGFALEKVLPDEGEVNRGIFNISIDNYVQKIDEYFKIHKNNLKENKLTSNNLCSMNIFALHPETIHNLHELVEKFKEKNKGHRTAESLIPHELTTLIKDGRLKMKIMRTPDTWLGVTNPDDEQTVRKILEKPQETKLF